MNADTRNSLKQFFGGYFHQDWHLDDATWEDAVRRFADESSSKRVNEVRDGLLELLNISLSEGELRKTLYEDYGCYYAPLDVSLNEWLMNVKAALASCKNS